jgi:hypothetical protein
MIGNLDTKSTIAVQMPKGEASLPPLLLLIVILLLLGFDYLGGDEIRSRIKSTRRNRRA